MKQESQNGITQENIKFYKQWITKIKFAIKDANDSLVLRCPCVKMPLTFHCQTQKDILQTIERFEERVLEIEKEESGDENS